MFMSFAMKCPAIASFCSVGYGARPPYHTLYSCTLLRPAISGLKLVQQQQHNHQHCSTRALSTALQEQHPNSIPTDEPSEFDAEQNDKDSISDDDNDGGSKVPCLRIDHFDEERDFWRRRPRPRLDVDSSSHRFPAKPGKRQNLPPKARKMILQLRETPAEEFPSVLRACRSMNPERAEWMYVIRFFREKEDKSMLLQVYDFVLLEPAFRASAQDYTNLIKVHIELKNYATVENILQVMRERDIFPDLVTYTVLIAMYSKVRNLVMVKKKFGEMKLWGLVPDTLVYCALIEAYSQLGHAREAEMLLDEMDSLGLGLKIEIFVSIIRGYGIIGSTKDAERVFQLMQLKCFYPERRSYSALMDAYTKDNDTENAIQVFNNMISIGIEPTDKSLARLIIACENKNMLTEATNIIETLETRSFKFGTKTLISFNAWLEKLGLEGKTKKLSYEISRRLQRKAYISAKFLPVNDTDP